MSEIGQIRVLTVSHYFATNGYGVELIAGRVNELLRARGFRVRWLAAAAQNRVTRSTPTRSDEIGIPSWDGIRVATDLAFPLFALWHVRTIVREVREADVVHLHEAFYPLNQVALWSAVLLRRPILITQHIADMPVTGAARGNAVRLANLVMTRPSFAVADRIVYYSRRTQALLRKLTLGKDVFIWNGCDSELFHPVPRAEARSLRMQLGFPVDRPVVLFVGRFIEKKGLERLQALAQAQPHAQFVFIGSGPMDPRDWNLPNVVVESAKPQAELARFYQSSDVLLLPAVGEGLPLVFQEANCCGLPTIVSHEVLEAAPELEPFAYDAGPGGARLDRTFSAFLSAPEPDQRRSDRATLARNLWSWERCGDAYAEVIRELAEESARGRVRFDRHQP